MTVRVTTLKSGSAGRYYTEHLPSYYLDGDEPPGSWRPLLDRAETVYDQINGGSAHVHIDISLLVDWDLPPDRYSIDLVFDVRPQ